MSVGALFAVFGLLFGRATAVRTGNILFLLGLGLHFALVGVLAFPTATKVNAILQYHLEVISLIHT